MWLVARGATAGVPGKRQAFIELCVEFVNGQVKSIFDKSYDFVAPLALTVFVWVLFMNAMDFLPVDWIAEGLKLAGVGYFRPVPTADINTTFALALSGGVPSDDPASSGAMALDPVDDHRVRHRDLPVLIDGEIDRMVGFVQIVRLLGGMLGTLGGLAVVAGVALGLPALTIVSALLVGLILYALWEDTRLAKALDLLRARTRTGPTGRWTTSPPTCWPGS